MGHGGRARIYPVRFAEGEGMARNVYDLLTTRYPSFVFGGSIKRLLPVFHFHEVTPEVLEPRLRYLAENGYQTVTSDAITQFVRREVKLAARSVALCFDDAWASLWTVAAPLLRRYGLTAITYAVPARIQEAANVRPTLEDGLKDPAAVDRSDTPFVTWPELCELLRSGVVDVQSHTNSHSMVFVDDQPTGFVTPDYYQRPLLARALISNGEPVVHLTPADLGAPLYPQRSRMSDGIRYFDSAQTRQRCMDWVKQQGGESFFKRPDWRRQLERVARNGGQAADPGRFEQPKEQEKAIRDELACSRDLLNERLGTTVKHMCFPWSTAGETAVRMAREVGYQSAFANRPLGVRAVHPGDDPYRMMRLKNDYIFALPGKGRKIFTTVEKLIWKK